MSRMLLPETKAVLTIVIRFEDVPGTEDIQEVLESCRNYGRLDVAKIVYTPPLMEEDLLK